MCNLWEGLVVPIPTFPVPPNILILSLAPPTPVKNLISCAVALVVAKTNGCALVVPIRVPLVPFQASVVEFPAKAQPDPPPPPDSAEILT